MAFVQRGSITIAEGSTTVTIDLPEPVPVGQSWVLSKSRGTDYPCSRSLAKVELLTVVNGNYTQLKATRDSTIGTCYVEWEVISGREFTVQSGEDTMAVIETNKISLPNTVDLTKAFPVISVMAREHSASYSFVRSRLFDSQTLEFQIGKYSDDSRPTISWQVVEWARANVQVALITNTSFTSRANISTIDPEQTFVLTSWHTTESNAANDIFIRTRIYLDGTQWKVECQRGAPDGDCYVAAYVISHPNIFVQSLEGVVASNRTTRTISKVDLSRAIAAAGYLGNAYTDVYGDYTLHHGFNTHRLVDATTVMVEREGVSGYLWANIQVVEIGEILPRMKVKIDGAWKDIQGLWCKASGTWKEVTGVFTKVADNWEKSQ